MEDDPVPDMRAGQFAVVRMADGRRKAFRIVQVWHPGELVHFCGLDIGPAPCRRVHLERLCLANADSVLQVLDTEMESRVFELERELEEARASLLREREAHAVSRERLRSIRRTLASL